MMNTSVSGKTKSQQCPSSAAWTGNCLKPVSKPATISLIGRTTMKNRISKRLLNHQNELRKRALKEKDEKLRKDYWWLYHDAKDIEPEIREMILQAENRQLIEMM